MASTKIENVGDLRALIADPNIPDNLPVRMAYEHPYANRNAVSRVEAAEVHLDGLYIYES